MVDVVSRADDLWLKVGRTDHKSFIDDAKVKDLQLPLLSRQANERDWYQLSQYMAQCNLIFLSVRRKLRLLNTFLISTRIFQI